MATTGEIFEKKKIIFKISESQSKTQDKIL